MGKTKIKVDLTHDGLLDAQLAVVRYKMETMRKWRLVLDRLADKGIQAAKIQMRTDIDEDHESYDKYIAFSKDISEVGGDVKCILVATNTGLIQSRWINQNGTQTADVSPLLMLEFGAGTIAGNSDASKFGMGTGTFPGQTHAGDENGWWYLDADTMEWHHSYGVKAKMPIQEAANEMIRVVRQTIKEVFG